MECSVITKGTMWCCIPSKRGLDRKPFAFLSSCDGPHFILLPAALHTNQLRGHFFQRFSRMPKSLAYLLWYLEILFGCCFFFYLNHVCDTVPPCNEILFKPVMFKNMQGLLKVALLLCLIDVLWVSIQNRSHHYLWSKRGLTTRRSLYFSTRSFMFENWYSYIEELW